MKILLVEDQKNMAYAIEEILRKNKYIVDLAFSGDIGLDQALNFEYDLIILDIMLPEVNGLEILKAVRAKNINTPILMLTAKSEVSDKVKGLDLGADDYLAKPFLSEELLARIRALLRRGTDINLDAEYSFKGITLDMNKLELKSKNKCYSLTVKEAQLMQLFISKPEIVVAKDTIINKLWSLDKVVIDNNVEVYISFLRKKLATITDKVKIKTVKGLGYKLISE